MEVSMMRFELHQFTTSLLMAVVMATSNIHTNFNHLSKVPKVLSSMVQSKFCKS